MDFLSTVFDLQSKSGANFFATSRRVLNIMERFKESTSYEIRATDNDVREYIHHHMDRLPSFINRRPVLQEEVKAKIAMAVEGMYVLLTGLTKRIMLTNLNVGFSSLSFRWIPSSERCHPKLSKKD